MLPTPFPFVEGRMLQTWNTHTFLQVVKLKFDYEMIVIYLKLPLLIYIANLEAKNTNKRTNDC